MSCRIAMIGAGSPGFSLAILRELVRFEVLKGSVFVMMDIDRDRLAESAGRARSMVANEGAPLTVEETTDRREALDGADFVVTSYAPHRVDFWVRDIEIAARHGIHTMHGENGGPAGQVHALRNITIMKGVSGDMEQLCPDAWLMNFTNPMSMLCTWLNRFSRIRSLGFCHQVHGTFGVIAEMMGMAPGDLRVITAGINHMNFLIDIRRRGHSGSYMEEFLAQVRKNRYWKENHERVPQQKFTLDFLETFGVYPVGYDNHITEYMPFFYRRDDWGKHGIESHLVNLRAKQKMPRTTSKATLDNVEIERTLGKGKFPFPADPSVDYYKETPVSVMAALLTSEPLYLDAMVMPNNGSIANLPREAVVDIPAVIAGGRARGVDVGELPFFAAELCRRQIAVHELVARAAQEGDRDILLKALCLDPFTEDLPTMRALMEEYLREYREYLPQFHGG